MMKRFKFGLVGILLGLFGLITFCNAGTGELVKGENLLKGESTRSSDISITAGMSDSFVLNTQYKFVNNTNSRLSFCFDGVGSSNFIMYFANSEITIVPNTNQSACIVLNPVSYGNNFDCLFTTNSNITLSYTVQYAYESNYTSLECQSEYSLMPVSSCDTNYCVENDLCPVPSNFSQLFINDIEHQSAPLINITIPYEYSWDSSVDSGQFDLVISGYNVDYDYIDNIVRTQNSKPSTEDFNNIITGLIPLFIPGLVIILFIWFVFKFIKKIL